MHRRGEAAAHEHCGPSKDDTCRSSDNSFALSCVVMCPRHPNKVGFVQVNAVPQRFEAVQSVECFCLQRCGKICSAILPRDIQERMWLKFLGIT